MSDDMPLLLYESQAKRFGFTSEQIEAAKKAPQPCPSEWLTPYATWMVYTMIPRT